jgi:hypothetical protein
MQHASSKHFPHLRRGNTARANSFGKTPLHSDLNSAITVPSPVASNREPSIFSAAHGHEYQNKMPETMFLFSASAPFIPPQEVAP